MPRFKDQAICIRLIDWSETSQIVALLTEQHGKLRGVAKGSKRTSPSAVARFSGGIEMLTLGEALGVIKPNADLAVLTEWDLQQPFRHLRQDLKAQQLGLYAADLANAFIAEADAHPASFRALADLLEQLDPALAEAQGVTWETAREAALLRFQWRLLSDCGYRPELSADVASGQPLPERAMYAFDAAAGGLTDAAPQPPRRWGVRRQTVDLLRAVAGGEPLESHEPAGLQRANRLLCVYARVILDRELPTMRFVRSEKPLE